MKRNAEDDRSDDNKKAKAPSEPASAPSSESAEAATAEDTGNLRGILRANEAEDQYQGIMDAISAGDPTVLFGWHRVEDFVRAIQTAQAHDGDALPPCPFALPTALTVDSFKSALLDYVQVEGAPARTADYYLECPTTSHCMRVASKLMYIDLHPWTRRVIEAAGGPDLLPIASVSVNRPGSDKLDDATEQYCPFEANLDWMDDF